MITANNGLKMFILAHPYLWATVPTYRLPPAFYMDIDMEVGNSVIDYIRVLDFISREVSVHWTEDKGKH